MKSKSEELRLELSETTLFLAHVVREGVHISAWLDRPVFCSGGPCLRSFGRSSLDSIQSMTSQIQAQAERRQAALVALSKKGKS